MKLRVEYSLSPAVDEFLEQVSASCGITKSEAIRRALELYKRAVKADKVLLKDAEGGIREVIVR